MSRRSSGGGRSSENVDCKVYVGDLERDVSERDLEKVFREFGSIRSVWVARNPPGFAFIEFEDERDAADAVRELDGTSVTVLQSTLPGLRMTSLISQSEIRNSSISIFFLGSDYALQIS